MYRRQETMNVRIPSRAYVLGTGGIGTWIATELALVGVPILHLFDEDKLEVHNLNRLLYGREAIGIPKTKACKRTIMSVRPDCRVVEHPFITREEEVLNMDGVIINSMDFPAKGMVQALSNRKEIWTVGANATRYSITNQVASKKMWKLSDDDQYTGIYAPTVMMCASHLVGLLTSGVKGVVNISMDIRKI